MPEPITNEDILKGQEKLQKTFKEHADADVKVAEDQAEVNKQQITTNEEVKKSLDSIHEWKGTVPTKEDTAEIVEAVIRRILTESGKKGYAGLLVIAGIVGALVVIGGGAKALLGFIGISLIHK